MKQTKKTYMVAGVAAVVFGVAIDQLVRAHIFGLNMSLFIGLWCAAALAVMAWERRFSLRYGVYLFFAVLSAVLIYFRADPTLQFSLFILAVTSLLMLHISLSVENEPRLSLAQRPFAFLWRSLESLHATPIAVLKAFPGCGQTSRTFPVGVLIAVGLGLVFTLLFASADQVLGSWFSHFSNLFGGNVAGHVVLIGFWAFVSLILLGALVERRLTEVGSTPEFAKFLSGSEAKLILGTVAAVFAVFVLLQLRYLFAGAALPDSLTYAEYAHRGYGQLLVATLLAAAVIKFVLSSAKNTPVRSEKILALVLIVLNLVVVLAAWKRLSLYEATYGWTMLRFIARLGLICIALGSGALAAWVVSRVSSRTLYASGWYITAGVLLVAALLNPAGIIAHKNLTERPSRSVALDVPHMMSLTPDALPVICREASALAAQYPREYELLKNSLEASHPEVNSGISRHYTHSQGFIDHYAHCLK